jgi:hypothetical protein
MAAPSVDDLARSFERYLRAGNKSHRTIETDLEAARGFAHLPAISGRTLDRARHEDVEAWIGVLLGRWKPATPTTATGACTPSTAGWRRKPPAVPDQPLPVLTEPQLRALFAVCSGKTSRPAATPRC